MRHFELPPIILDKGLRTFWKEARGEYQIFDLYNLMPTEAGLVPYLPVQYPFNVGIALDWPFPQFFVGEEVVLLATRNTIYYAKDKRYPWVPIPLDLYDFVTGEISAITPGGSWSFASFGRSWFLTNGSCTVFDIGKDTMFGNPRKVYVQDGVTIKAANAYKGRVFFGGFSYLKDWSEDWEAFWQDWMTKVTDTGISENVPRPAGYGQVTSNVVMPLESNWVWWSTIGGGDALMLFSKDLMETGFVSSSYGNLKPYLFDLLKRNEQGFAPMPWKGTVHKIMQLGDYNMVYGSGGITALKAVSEPAPTMAILEPLPKGIGIVGPGAVGGDKNHHIFVDQSGLLWHIDSQLKATVLGYQEYLSPMLSEDIMISYSSEPVTNSPFGIFFIGTSSKTYCLNERGLFEVYQRVPTAINIDGGTVGAVVEAAGQVYEATLGVSIGHLLMPGHKTLEYVFITANEDVAAGGLSTLSCAVDYRYNSNDDWKTTPYKRFNDAGWVYFPVSGVDFRLKIKVDNYEKCSIERITVGYSVQDRRFRRGIPINKT